MIRQSKKLILSIFFALLMHVCYGQNIFLNRGIEELSLNEKITLFEIIDSIPNFQKNLENELHLLQYSKVYDIDEESFKKKYYWFKVNIVNLNDEHEKFIFNINNYTIGRIEFFISQNDRLLSSDNIKKENKYVLPLRNFALPLKIDSGDSLGLVIKFWSNGDPLASAIKIYSENHFIEKETEDNYVYGYYFSFFLIVLIISTITWFFLRERFVIFYTLHLLCLGAFLFSFEGFSQYFFSLNIQFVKEIEQPILCAGIGVFFILFVLSFFNIKKSHPFTNKLNHYLVWLFTIAFIFSLAFDFLNDQKGTMAAFISILMIWAISISLFIYTIKLKVEVDRHDFWFYFAAFALEAIGLSFHFWAYFGILPSVWFDLKIIHITSLIEIIIFTYFIIDKVIKLNKSRGMLALNMAAQKEKSFKNILKGEENERQRIAKELHDGLGLMLSTINTRLSDLAEKGAEGSNNNLLKKISMDIEQACTDVRTTSHALASHILNRNGFVYAVENDISVKKSESSNIAFNFNSQVEQVNLSKFDTTILYKVWQDLFNEILIVNTIQSVATGILEEDENLIINFRLEGFSKEDYQAMELKNILARLDLLHGSLNLFERKKDSLMIMIEVPIKEKLRSDEVILVSKTN